MNTLCKNLLWPLMLLMILILAAWQPTADAAQAHHDLHLRLDLEKQALTGDDTITIANADPGPLVLRLAPRARIERLTLNEQPLEYRFNDGRIHLQIPAVGASDEARITIRYRCRFDDPAPVQPINTDNPGYGVSGTISPAGVLLLSGAGWLPEPLNMPATYDLSVEAPRGVVAVTAGRSLGIEHQPDRTISTWRIARPTADGPSLSAGAYQVREKQVGSVTVATYLTTANADLAERYLESSARYIDHFSRLLGPYPFEKFAVVENFFPTGYGFPSYTLMGGRVLRLPFIVHTSLGHEIAHCWWGNGVRVDYADGNWCEGLTAYVADYYSKELQDAEEAEAYRRRWLRNYANLVRPPQDFPLARFHSRSDRSTQTIGYDKAAMVFHMLRQQVGDDRFWQTLRDLYRRYLFKTMGWRQIQHAFEQAQGNSLAWFFRQWVFQKGAPQLRLEGVTRARHDQGWAVSGHVVQAAPAFRADTEIRIESAAGGTIHWLTVSGIRTPFNIAVDAAPLGVEVDPGAHLFRRLDPTEVPSTVNTLKGAEDLLVVFAEGFAPALRELGPLMAASLGIDGATYIDERDLNARPAADQALLFIGRPQHAGLMPLLPDLIHLENDGFRLAGNRFRDPADALFMVVGEPRQPRALFWPLSVEAASAAWRKITHYGNYSYLAFRDGGNLEKGTWPATTSPLRIQWPDVKAP
jgi:hypothetical protein